MIASKDSFNFTFKGEVMKLFTNILIGD